MSKSSLLFVTSEVYPFAKTGGLADVMHSLPRALIDYYAVRVVLPLYQSIDRQRYGIIATGESYNLVMGGVEYPIEYYGCTYENVEYCFVYSSVLCDREFLYGPPECGYEDNDIRFGVFNHAVVELLKRHSYPIAHLNDWQSALVPLLIKRDGHIETRALFTIHNLAYQGNFDATSLERLGISSEYFTMDGVEFHGMMSFIKAGIAYADMVTTVSPTYAKEILKPSLGFGMEGFLAHHSAKLSGILNGIDIDHFSPLCDSTILHPYSNLTGKAVNKKDFLKQIGLKGANKPLFVFIGRLVSQKGVDLLIEALPPLATMECNIALLGEGEGRYKDAIESVVKAHPNVHVTFAHDEALAHRMYAAADFLLMPSLFEPCGLNQIIAMSYGALPIVHSVGGLADTVHSIEKFDPEKDVGFGIVFTKFTQRAFMNAIHRAIDLYSTKQEYKAILNHNMKCDFSWKKSLKRYLSLYKKMIG